MITADFRPSPTCYLERSAFVGEDIRSAKVLRHIDLPFVAIAYALKNGKIAYQVSRLGGMLITINLYDDRAEFEAAEARKNIYDPETGRRR